MEEVTNAEPALIADYVRVIYTDDSIPCFWCGQQTRRFSPYFEAQTCIRCQMSGTRTDGPDA